jgi:DNA replicative helicase MCM subunit Mcm2 (Cdc46/Mcm family)
LQCSFQDADNLGPLSQFSAERIEELRQLSQDPGIYEKLAQSMAPSIWYVNTNLDACRQ